MKTSWMIVCFCSVLGCLFPAHGEMPDLIEVVRPEDPPVLSIDEVAKSAAAPGAVEPLELSYLERRGPWLLTYHEGKGKVTGTDLAQYYSRAALYWQTEDGFVLQAQWLGGVQVQLSRPRFVQMSFDKQRASLLWVPGRVSGTGAYREDAMFHLTRQGGLQPVDFEPAPQGYVRLSKAGVPEAVLNEGEGVWKGELNSFYRPAHGFDRMAFKFYLWNKGDGNSSPTAGKVEGTYKLVKTEEGFRIEIDTLTRTSFDKP